MTTKEPIVLQTMKLSRTMVRQCTMMPQLHSRQDQKYRPYLVALRKRRTLTSAQRNHAIPMKAAAVMDSGRVWSSSCCNSADNMSILETVKSCVIVRRVRAGPVLGDSPSGDGEPLVSQCNNQALQKKQRSVVATSRDCRWCLGEVWLRVRSCCSGPNG
jgi:hypothetical protein